MVREALGAVAGDRQRRYKVADMERFLRIVEGKVKNVWDPVATKRDEGNDFGSVNNRKAQWNDDAIHSFGGTFGNTFSKARWKKLLEIIRHVRG